MRERPIEETPDLPGFRLERKPDEVPKDFGGFLPFEDIERMAKEEEKKESKEKSGEKNPDDDCPMCGGSGSCLACESGRKRDEQFRKELEEKKGKKKSKK